MSAISRRRASSNGNGSSLLDGGSDHTPFVPVLWVCVFLAFLVAGCGGSSSRSPDDAARYLAVQLESTARAVNATVGNVECKDEGGDKFGCNAFNSLSGEQTYTVVYKDGRWGFSNDGN